jgi:hypothetical protein
MCQRHYSESVLPSTIALVRLERPPRIQGSQPREHSGLGQVRQKHADPIAVINSPVAPLQLSTAV